MSFDWGPTASKRLLVIADRDEKIRALEQQLADFKLSHATVDAQREKAEAALAVLVGWRGDRVRIKPGWEGAGRIGTVLGPPVDEGQFWLPVKWDDEEDPYWHKLAGIEDVIARDLIGQERAAGRESGEPERLNAGLYASAAAKPAALGAPFVPPLPPSADGPCPCGYGLPHARERRHAEARTPLGPVEKEQLKRLVRSAETQEGGT